MYEQSEMVAQYIEFHYGDSYFNVPNFPKTCAQSCIEFMGNRSHKRALDLGCATGRSSFELATFFSHVDAVDFSHRLVEIPLKFQTKGQVSYLIKNEGALTTRKTLSLSDFAQYEEVKNNIHFMQGDACQLPDTLNNYDLVFAGNLLDRLYDPLLFLNHVKERINKGGLLILTSPYTWLEDFTEPNKWLGGFKTPEGAEQSSLNGLSNALTPEFKMIAPPKDIEFVIRETCRKFQHTLSQMSVWEKQ